MKKKGELPDEIKRQLARYEELLQYDNATVSKIDAYRDSLPNRQLINNSSYDAKVVDRDAESAGGRRAIVYDDGHITV